MVAEPAHRGKGPFPEIRIVAMGGERRAPLVLTPAAQMAAASGLICGALALGYLAISQASGLHRVAQQERAAVRAEIANTDLQDAVARLQDRLARAAGDRAEAESRLSAIATEAGALRGRLAAAETKVQASRGAEAQQPGAAGPSPSISDRIAQLREALARTRLEAHALAAESATLAARLNKTRADRAAENTLSRRYEASLAEARHAARRPGGRR
ncbi:MAG TPA: hypothetical protein VJ770_09645 [Stellaceae bacterium]|nr:hypothetical protein [Stellaceae bacterium]